MRKIAVSATTAVVALLAGCGSGSNGRADTVQGASTKSDHAKAHASTSFTLTGAEIKSRLLRVTDMPTGFTVDRSKDDSGDTPSGCKKLDALDNYPKRTKVDKEVKFTGGTFGPFVSEDVSIPNGSAKAIYQSFVAAMQECPSFKTKNDDGSYSTVTIDGMSFPKFEDDTFAAQMRIAPVPMVGSAYVDLVVVRIGSLFVLLSDAQVAAAPDAATVESMTRLAVKRLRHS